MLTSKLTDVLPSTRSPGPMGKRTCIHRSSAATPPWRIITPLGRPVDPLV